MARKFDLNNITKNYEEGECKLRELSCSQCDFYVLCKENPKQLCKYKCTCDKWIESFKRVIIALTEKE